MIALMLALPVTSFSFSSMSVANSLSVAGASLAAIYLFFTASTLHRTSVTFALSWIVQLFAAVVCGHGGRNGVVKPPPLAASDQDCRTVPAVASRTSTRTIVAEVFVQLRCV